MSSKIDNYLLKLDEKIKSKLSVNELNKIKLELFDLRKDYSKKSKILLLIAEISWLLLEIEDAIFYFNEALLLNPNSNDAKLRLNKAKKEKADLITYLTFNNPKIETNNPILNANNEIREIKYKITDLDEIPDKLIFEIYEKAHSIVNNYKIDIESEETQIYRKTNLKYNCDRHFKVFNTFQFIPENCFGCYKVQVLPKNVIDLIK